jgi:RNA recognition motif-containing protein
MRLYVANLPYSASKDELREAFDPFGNVVDVYVVMDRDSNRSRGFAFVEMAEAAEGQAAIDALDGKDWQGRTLKVSQARPRGGEGQGRDG